MQRAFPTGQSMRANKLTERGHKWSLGGFDALRSASALFLFCALTAITSNAQTFTILVNFDNTNGALPTAPPVQGLDGKFYGTTTDGGTNAVGTVFKITSAGQFTTLYNFCSLDKCGDGANPSGELLLALDGDFYGTTSDGGGHGDGEVFKISASGKFTRLGSFRGASRGQGAHPGGALIQGTDGDFYGTAGGGRNQSGTIFKMTPKGSLTTLYSFCAQNNCDDGAEPGAVLVQATNGNFYGTTVLGGAEGKGTVFGITPAGKLTTLYSFCAESNCTDGANPYAGLVQATNGDLYGTTFGGGANGEGTVFKITYRGKLTTLYSFCSQTNCTDGSGPTGLVQGTGGNLYGATGGGTEKDGGTAFEMTPEGQLTTLYGFDHFAATGLTQGTDGKFYGTSFGGGTNDNGTVFSLAVGFGPFVETLPASGKVGATVKILGTNLTGSTSVTFNGTAATFTVVSSSEIDTTVPAGATTGKVKVITPRHKLSTNVPFRVTSAP
jgi:uncharacterized repeat protein (TIGR03803 family)